jgi:hypothetical protein
MNGRSGGFSNVFLVSDLNGYSLLINLAFPILTLRQAQGERIGKAFSDTLPSTGSGRSRMNGLKNMPLTSPFRHAQDERGERIEKARAILSTPFDPLSHVGCIDWRHR